jgi:hypothetical protein
LPGVTHYNIMESPLLAEVVGPFLNINTDNNIRTEAAGARTAKSESVAGKVRHNRIQHRGSAGSGAVGG